MRSVPVLLILLLGILFLGCAGNIPSENIPSENVHSPNTTCGGKTVYGEIEYDTPFHFGKCSLGTDDAVLIFHKNCYLKFYKVVWKKDRKYIEAYADGDVTYTVKAKERYITAIIGNETITAKDKLTFKASGVHEVEILIDVKAIHASLERYSICKGYCDYISEVTVLNLSLPYPFRVKNVDFGFKRVTIYVSSSEQGKKHALIPIPTGRAYTKSLDVTVWKDNKDLSFQIYHEKLEMPSITHRVNTSIPPRTISLSLPVRNINYTEVNLSSGYVTVMLPYALWNNPDVKVYLDYNKLHAGRFSGDRNLVKVKEGKHKIFVEVRGLFPPGKYTLYVVHCGNTTTFIPITVNITTFFEG